MELSSPRKRHFVPSKYPINENHWQTIKSGCCFLLLRLKKRYLFLSSLPFVAKLVFKTKCFSSFKPMPVLKRRGEMLRTHVLGKDIFLVNLTSFILTIIKSQGGCMIVKFSNATGDYISYGEYIPIKFKHLTSILKTENLQIKLKMTCRTISNFTKKKKKSELEKILLTDNYF